MKQNSGNQAVHSCPAERREFPVSFMVTSEPVEELDKQNVTGDQCSTFFLFAFNSIAFNPEIAGPFNTAPSFEKREP